MAKLRIKEVAEMRGINQSQLQIKSGVTLPLLSRYWKNRTDSVNLEAIEKIANALEVKPGELLIPDSEAVQEEEEPSAA